VTKFLKMVFQVFLNLKDKYFTISSNVYYIKKYFRHNFTVLKTKINNTKFLGHNGFAQSCALFLNMDPGEMWRNVAECGEMWRNVAKCGEMWRNVAECGGMWRKVAKC
jgi:hypothetical protein